MKAFLFFILMSSFSTSIFAGVNLQNMNNDSDVNVNVNVDITDYISSEAFYDCCPGPACISDSFTANLFAMHIKEMVKEKSNLTCDDLVEEAESLGF